MKTESKSNKPTDSTTAGSRSIGGPVQKTAQLQEPAVLLVGSWRSSNNSGFSSTFAFDRDGSLTYYTTGANLLLNIPVAGVEAYGRWSVRNNTMFIEFTGANNQALVPVFRGMTGRSPIRFVDENAVELSGIEGDTVKRTYSRVR